MFTLAALALCLHLNIIELGQAEQLHQAWFTNLVQHHLHAA